MGIAFWLFDKEIANTYNMNQRGLKGVFDETG
jgi:hypothetical protein